MKEFVCEDCKGKSYSAADLDKQINPECPYCGSKKLKDTSKHECTGLKPGEKRSMA